MLVLIVGPSGAGKDTLLNVVRGQLAGDARVRFAIRDVTRPPSAEEKNHHVSRPDFLARRESGGYALWWEAHGLFYGINADVKDDLAAGRVVVASVSRSILAEAALHYPVRVVEITASPEVLAHRLAGRGRESAGEIASRLARQVPIPASVDCVRIVNDGAVEAAAEMLMRAIMG
jgi:phosphonate metabolism protein PhnN/1,5-bisphosphokinase (PRPP-forming)